MKMRFKRAMLMATMAISGSVLAEDFAGSGWLDVPNAAWFSSYGSVLFGEGTFNYQGGDVIYAGSFAFNPSGARKVSTLVVPEGTTMTLAAGGQIVKSGAVVKTGLGTLVFGGSDISFASSTAPDFGTAPQALVWDTETGALTSGIVGKGLNVHEGAVAISNATVNFGTMLRDGAMGSAHDAAVTLENVRVKTMEVLAIGSCATNPAGATPVSRFTARNCAFDCIGTLNVSFPTAAYGSGQKLNSEVLFDNCIVTNTTLFKIAGDDQGGATARATVTLDNGTAFVNRNMDSAGVTGGANLNPTFVNLNVLGGSTLLAENFGMDTYYTAGAASNVVTIGKGSTFGSFRTVSSSTAARWSWLHVDGGTIRPWSRCIDDAGFTKCAALLFHRWDNAYVDAGGATLMAPPHYYAYLFPALFENPLSTGGSLAVTGGGTFAISPTDVPIEVKDGSTLVFTPRHFLNEDTGLLMNGDHLDYDPLIRNSSISVASGSAIRVLGLSQALMDMTLPAADISFSANGGNEALSYKLGVGKRRWVKAGGTSRLYDGDGSMTVMSGQFGSKLGTDDSHNVVYANPIDLTRSFRITLEYSNAAFRDRVVKGVVAYIHNDSRGAAATGSGNFGIGYTTNDTSTAKIDKSVGVMLRTWNSPQGLSFCKNGLSDVSTLKTFPTALNIGYYLQPDRIRPLVFTLSYDATAKKFSYAVTSPYGDIYSGANRGVHSYEVSNTVDADLSSICGATGYFGFSASADGGSPIEHQIANVSIRYVDEMTRPCVDVAGHLNLGSATANLSAYGTDTTAGYAMRELKFANGGTLAVASTNLASGAGNTAFVAFDRWTGSGTVHKTGSGNLGVRVQCATNATLDLAEGGLVLRKDYEDPYVFDGDSRTNRDWVGVQWAGSVAVYGYYRNVPIYENSDTIYCGSGDSGRNGSTALKRLLKVSGKWTMSFDYESQQNDGAYGMFVTFHNDPRGYAACTGSGVSARGYSEGAGLVAATAEKSIKNCAAIQFYNYADNTTYTNENHKIKWWQSDANGTFTSSAELLSKTQPDSTGNQQIFIANYNLKGVGAKVARKFHCVISSDDSAALPLTITLTQTQGMDGTEGSERRWSKSFAKNIPAAVGGDLCNFGLFFSSGGQTTRVQVKNFTFKHDDATESNAKPYFGEVDVSAANATVYLDGSKASTYTLAKKVNLSGGLTVKSLREAAVLSLGAAKIPAKAQLAADGTTVKLTAKDDIDPAALIALRNGGTLNLDFAGVLNLNKLEIDGKVYHSGLFSAETTSRITGTGALAVGKGFLLFLR